MAISVGMGECPASPYLSLSLLSIPPLALPPSPSFPSSFPPLYFSILPHQLFWRPTTYNPATPPHPHCLPFSQQGSSGHCSRSLPPSHLQLASPPPSSSSSTPPHLLFLSERMFQTLHTDSSGILCVEMFLLDPQALTIYWTKASAPLLKTWHLWPPARTSDLSPWLIFLSLCHCWRMYRF